MAQRDRDLVAAEVTGEQRLQIILGEALAAATGRALRESGHRPTPDQLGRLPGFLVRLAGAQAAHSFAEGPPQLTQADVDAWAERTALDLVMAIFGPPAVVN
jgi:hypothetical protein